MSDSKLRALERLWRESGSEEDEVALLRELLRIGELDQRRLELAAHCGFSLAAGVLDRSPPEPVEGLERWIRGAFVSDRVVWLRSSIAAARAALRTASPMWGLREIESAIEAAEDWVVCPCDEHAERAQEAALQATWRNIAQDGLTSESPTCRAATRACAVITHRSPDATLPEVYASQAAGEATVRGAVCEELVPWLLGRDDAIARRVASRGQRRQSIEAHGRGPQTEHSQSEWLREGLRIGAHTIERLQVAAYCGHEPARVALDPRHRPTPWTPVPWQFLSQLVEAPEILARACQALGMALSRCLEGDDSLLAECFLAELDRWITEPTLATAHAMWRVGDLLQQQPDKGRAAEAIKTIAEYRPNKRTSAEVMLRSSEQLLGLPSLQAALAAELVPWALGTVDPARERRAKRKAGPWCHDIPAGREATHCQDCGRPFRVLPPIPRA